MARKPHEGSGTLAGAEESVEQAQAQDAAEPRPRAKRAKAAPRVSAPKVILYSLMAVTALGVGIYAFQLVEEFLIGDRRFALNGPDGFEDTPTFTVAGAAHAPVRSLEAVFRQDSGRSVYLIPIEERRAALQSVDWVKEASIARLWPNRLAVRVWERTPVAFLQNGGLVDAEGVILPPVPDRFRLPVLIGIRPAAPIVERKERVHRMLRLTGELGKEVTGEISEIDVTDRDNLRVTVPYEGRLVTLLLGDRDFAPRYKTFKTRFADISRHLPGAEMLDLRVEGRITAVQ